MLSRGGARGVTKAELSATLIQRTTSEAPQRRHVLHRTGCSQEDDQLLREGCGWSCAPGRQDRIDPARTGCLDPDVTSTPDDGHGSDDLHRLDLRLPASACREGEGGPSADAAGHRRIQEEERPDRCRQDRRLPAMRLSARVPHGFDRDPGPAPYAALPAPGGEAGGADEEPYIGATHGKWGQL